MTIIEALEQASQDLSLLKSVYPDIYKNGNYGNAVHRLDNAIEVLKKGWNKESDIETLVESYGKLAKIPDLSGEPLADALDGLAWLQAKVVNISPRLSRVVAALNSYLALEFMDQVDPDPESFYEAVTRIMKDQPIPGFKLSDYTLDGKVLEGIHKLADESTVMDTSLDVIEALNTVRTWLSAKVQALDD